MAENNHGKKVVDSFTIRETGEVVRAGDCVAIRPSMDDDHENLSLARVEKMETCCECRGVAAQVRWYYQPWQTKHGSRTFHGKKELHLSDRIDTRSAYTFEAKCVVHTLKEYSKLTTAQPEDFFCRLEYKVDSATFMPDQLSVYCICEMPYNPDVPMILCPGCKER
ncbi:hypothetical protein HU200_011992 [Digitaria exilis]|uniref:BAH domain-containing protein n=1 Tax=Digitaria exilis TaxID=1010633 RepID=A0A835FFF3_9POAL|nr:hypothetical protein HU200_011992 [Digitaria exilis]